MATPSAKALSKYQCVFSKQGRDDKREHDIHDYAGAPTVGGHADVAQMPVVQSQYTLGRKVRDSAANVECLLVRFGASKAKVGDLNAGVGPRRME